MADMMNFPKRWEDFLHDYEFEDARMIYTNGSRLIPSFRVKQMMEHYATVRNRRWKQARYTEAPLYICSECYKPEYKQHKFCPNCGARMDGGHDG